MSKKISKQISKQIYTVIVVILIVLVYMQIFEFSSANAEISEAQSMSVTEYIVRLMERVFNLDLPFSDSPEQMDRLDGIVRKTAHFSEYALLGFLTYSIAICWNMRNKKGTACSFLFVAALAAMDEFHQYFVPGRFSSLWDVCIDSTGCLVGMLLLSLLYGMYNGRKLKADRIS